MGSKLEARITKLEQQRKPNRIANHVVAYNPNVPGSWEAAVRNATPPYLVVRDFGTDEEWEKALAEQQEKLRIESL